MQKNERERDLRVIASELTADIGRARGEDLTDAEYEWVVSKVIHDLSVQMTRWSHQRFLDELPGANGDTQ